MSIQPVSGSGSGPNPLWQTLKGDFKTLEQTLTADQKARQSGTDVQISQDALQKAITAFQNDAAALHNQASGGVGSGGVSSASSPAATLNSDIQSLQSALQSGDQNQIASAETALQKDLSSHKGHHHHRHGAGNLSAASSTPNNSGSTTPPPNTID
ncbi:MAG: hypothetical protein HQL03_00125 [Nitrospirae bacterium]|nr:hypothetical protein [Nitrospirota bacterium]MBF0591168.1 hypothetical protein [Nitrospirota bacterium]